MDGREDKENDQKRPEKSSSKTPTTSIPLKEQTHNVILTNSSVPSPSKHRPKLSLEIPPLAKPIYPNASPIHVPSAPAPLWVSNFQPAPPNMTPWIPISVSSPISPVSLVQQLSPMHPRLTALTPPHTMPDLGSHSVAPLLPVSWQAATPPTSPRMMPGNYSNDEFGFGREAKALELAWAGLVLKGFTRKYPLTGTKAQVVESISSSGSTTPKRSPETSAPITPARKPAQPLKSHPTPAKPPAASILPPAYLIQQRLEELLLKKKEKKVLLLLQKAGFYGV